ncbi:ribonucleoside-diphosphate reductase alpha chain/ribonucleoside-triphosphate reductase [Seinonella peptonophila]|uniref:Adenosylcobalamin-dependent ribonucleoside-triphosphate reductase n=1 Tax=Seinonella peptonophila TaxID=112248 RepID=A0A1M4VE42_9BACL|nr:ribonucleoside-triphosphate reductase, adenosylcobalamin-dependent [Seinonella peptonophila]SHE67168.1 ribonucleoside-diphosphate reductase alpha chain/ribonucleoside-triphosphate reductase [Seinonella peptonophila]
MKKLISLPESFISQYKGKNPDWGFDGLGYVVYLRTYSRKKPNGTMEQWWETCHRVTEGNFNIEANRLKEIGKWTDNRKEELVKEMKRFYHLFFNLVICPPGRGLWMTGTEFAERVGAAENNCWFVSMRPQPYGDSKIKPVLGLPNTPLPSFAAAFTFDNSMLGGGVGVNVQQKNVEQMPKVARKVNITFECITHHPDYNSELKPLGVVSNFEFMNFDSPILSIKDSREGWVRALSLVIDSHFIGSSSNIVIDLSRIRARGTEIKGFGGIASGPAPLVQMLQRVNEILNNRVGEKLTSVDWGDIIQNIGCCVVAGNVRRTALILIGDQEGKDFVESKNYNLEKNQIASQWRWASNNSVDVSEETDLETLRELAKNIYYNGEPGYTNINLSRNYGRIADGYQEGIDKEVEGFNPCGEITLPNASPCNLFEINIPKIHELISSGKEPRTLCEEVCKLAARFAYRVTFRPYEWEATRDVVYHHRRLGVGITGFTDWLLMKFESIDDPGIRYYLDSMYRWVQIYNLEQAYELEAEPSIKVTTVKPSGTLSLLMGVSAGIHHHWSKYMIRRIRVAANAPIVQMLKECGYDHEPVYQGVDQNGNPIYDSNTLVFSFPIAAPTAHLEGFKGSGEVPLQEQAANQALLANYWSDNAVSATLTFKQEEGKEEDKIEEIAQILDQYKGVIKSTSLLPHAVGTYPQMPLEEITKEQYEEMSAKIKKKPWEITGFNLVSEDDENLIDDCEGGACPIR